MSQYYSAIHNNSYMKPVSSLRVTKEIEDDFYKGLPFGEKDDIVIAVNGSYRSGAINVGTALLRYLFKVTLLCVTMLDLFGPVQSYVPGFEQNTRNRNILESQL